VVPRQAWFALMPSSAIPPRSVSAQAPFKSTENGRAGCATRRTRAKKRARRDDVRGAARQQIKAGPRGLHARYLTRYAGITQRGHVLWF
jgi:hypothetical protein